MRKQLVLIVPILAAMIGMIAILGLNTVDANMTSSDGTIQVAQIQLVVI